MRRIVSGMLAFAVVALPFAQSSLASANSVVGGGYSSSYAGESVFTNNVAGETGQMSAIFFNDGTQTWAPGVIGLLVCAADKVTCNVPSNPSYKSGWFSNTVYATVSSTVAPGQNGFFVYDFTVPAGTPPGTVATFYGDVGIIATGAELRPEGYFQSNTTPVPAFNLTMTPSVVSVAVGSTQQFILGGAPIGVQAAWSVIGGCGAVTSAGLFAATSMNSLTQPCAVVASLGGASASAALTVYGLPSQLSCTGSPAAVVANSGASGGTSTITVALKDVNGNTVSNASAPVVQVSNNTPDIGTITPSGVLTPVNGVVTVTMASTLQPGAFELSASATGITGCYVFVPSSSAGPGVGTTAIFMPPTIASDGVSISTLRVDVVDAAGNRALADNITQLSISGFAGGDICGFSGSSSQGTNVTIGAFNATATVASGRVELAVRSTTTPGSCSVSVIPNSSSISGTSATLVTQIVGAPNQIALVSGESPKPASSAGGTCLVSGTPTDPSCTRVVVEVRDFNGARITGDNGRSITATLDASSCQASGIGAVTQADATPTSAGRATFAFRSAGAYPNCTVTFTSAGLNGTNASLSWTGGGANHLACVFSPVSIAADASSISNGQVTVRDASNNIVPGYNYTIIFNKTGGVSTNIVGSNQQTMSGGYANFTVQSTRTSGTDTYQAAIAAGGPTLPATSQACQVEVHP